VCPLSCFAIIHRQEGVGIGIDHIPELRDGLIENFKRDGFPWVLDLRNL